MGRHSTPDESDDDVSAEEIAQAQLAAEAQTALAETGKHNFGALATLTLAQDAPARADDSVDGVDVTFAVDGVTGDGRPDTAATSSARDGGWSPANGGNARGFAVPYGRSPYDANYRTGTISTGPGAASSAPDRDWPSEGSTLTAAPDSPVGYWPEQLPDARDFIERARDETGPDDAPPIPAKTSRAGRNLPAAIVVSLGLGAVIIASLLIYRPSFVVIVCLAMSYGIYEMVRAIGAAEARPPLVPLIVGGLAMDIAAWFHGANGLVLGLLITVLGVTVWRLAEGAVGYARDVTSAAFIALYVPALGGFAVLLSHHSDGAGRVIAFIATVVCSDVGGYTAGVLFGKHPMAPTVSPKKSWEGFVGSAVACSIGGGLFMSLLFHHRWWLGVLYGLAIAVTATLGDLGESMVKRDLGVKDMGRLLPGHGGLMDRLDSLLPCAAVAYLILSAALA